MAENQMVHIDQMQERIANRDPTLCDVKPRMGTGDGGGADAEDLTREQKQFVNRFYASVRVAWGGDRFDFKFVDEREIKFSKSFWGPRIVRWGESALKWAIDEATTQRLQGNSRFQYPDVGEILSLLEPKPDDEMELVLPAHRLLPKPPIPKRDPELAKAGIAHLREILDT